MENKQKSKSHAHGLSGPEKRVSETGGCANSRVSWWLAPSELTYPERIFEAIGEYFDALGIHGALQSVNGPLNAALNSEDEGARVDALTEVHATLFTANFLGRLYELHKRCEYLSLRDGKLQK